MWQTRARVEGCDGGGNQISKIVISQSEKKKKPSPIGKMGENLDPEIPCFWKQEAIME